MARAKLSQLHQRINEIMPESAVWSYQQTLRGERITHQWSLATKDGGVHIHGWRVDGGDWREWMGGVECHWSSAPEWALGDKPSHQHCWLLSAPCWHDGTSLYFSERIADTLPFTDELEDRHHENIAHELAYWYRSKILPEITRIQSLSLHQGDVG
jgi:hypothetical protein